MIDVRNASKSFGSRALWADLSFAVGRGEMLALTGSSGSGKTTLLNCIGLLESLDRGSVLVGGQDITRLSARARRRFRRDTLGYLFQNYALIENATIVGNLEVATGAGGLGRRRGAVSFDEALERVGLGGRGRETVYRLSGGEQQRVALARLLVRQPGIVLADEPTGALDHDNATMVIDLLRDLSAQGCAVVIATHNDEVVRRCDSVLAVGARPVGQPLSVG